MRLDGTSFIILHPQNIATFQMSLSSHAFSNLSVSSLISVSFFYEYNKSDTRMTVRTCRPGRFCFASLSQQTVFQLLAAKNTLVNRHLAATKVVVNFVLHGNLPWFELHTRSLTLHPLPSVADDSLLIVPDLSAFVLPAQLDSRCVVLCLGPSTAE